MAIGFQVTIDCADPAAMAEFWGGLLGYIEPPPPEGHESWQSWLEAMGIPKEDWNSANARIDPDGGGPRLYFQRVPEPKTVKNRVHLDVNVGAGVPTEERPAKVDAEVERAVALGAQKLRVVNERGEYWVVMQDAEGNEFCLQ
jgi:hypothetical protein